MDFFVKQRHKHVNNSTKSTSYHRNGQFAEFFLIKMFSSKKRETKHSSEFLVYRYTYCLAKQTNKI